MSLRFVFKTARVASAIVPVIIALEKSRRRRKYYENIGQLARRYHLMLIPNGNQADIDFVRTIIAESDKMQMPLTKLNRWLGYIQGLVIRDGLTSVQRERDYSRPLLRPLDYPNSRNT